MQGPMSTETPRPRRGLVGSLLRSCKRHLRSATLIVTALIAIACGQSIVVTGFPVKNPEKPESTSRDPESTSRDKYWSVYAYIEEQDIPRLWDTSSLDYVLVSAKVKLPTRTEPIVREFPLYTIERKLVQSHSGVDLLKRFPINRDAREQVSITLEVRYLANEEALKAARVVLKQAETLAEPYLKNFGLASQIMTKSVATIDEALEQDRGANSMTLWVDPTRLIGQPQTQAYLLRLMSDVKANPTYRSDRPLAECRNKDGALCKGGDDYRTARVSDVVYVTLRFVPNDDVHDPSALFPGGGNCGLITEAVLEKGRSYLQANEDLFVQRHVEDTMAAYDIASRYVKARRLAADKDFAGLLDLLNEAPPTLEPCASGGKRTSTLQQAQLCYHEFWLQSPGAEVFDAWAMLRKPGKPQEPINRFGALVYALRRVAGMSGTSYDPTKLDPWEKSSGYVVNLLHHEARMLLQEQERDVDTKKCEEIAFSPYCETCKTKFEKKCKAQTANPPVGTQTQALEVLEQNAEAVRKSLKFLTN